MPENGNIRTLSYSCRSVSASRKQADHSDPPTVERTPSAEIVTAASHARAICSRTRCRFPRRRHRAGSVWFNLEAQIGLVAVHHNFIRRQSRSRVLGRYFVLR